MLVTMDVFENTSVCKSQNTTNFVLVMKLNTRVQKENWGHGVENQ